MSDMPDLDRDSENFQKRLVTVREDLLDVQAVSRIYFHKFCH